MVWPRFARAAATALAQRPDESTAGTRPVRHYLRARIERADADNPIRFVAATEGVKADGIDLWMSRLDLARWRTNPVIGYGHDYFGRESLPIGRAVTTTVDGDRLLTEVEFDQADDFATTVEHKIRGGFLNAVSVGFEAGSIDRDGVPDWWELVEVSVVPIPLDAGAVADSRDGQALEMMRDALRAGKVLSSSNEKLVADAVQALNALLDAAGQDDGPRGREAISGHSTGTTEAEWDADAALAAADNDESTLRHMHAWVDGDADAEAKSSYSLPHHTAGTDTAANLSGVRNALSRLPQSDIPEAQQDAVRAHLQRHLDDAERALRRDKIRVASAEAALTARDAGQHNEGGQ